MTYPSFKDYILLTFWENITDWGYNTNTMLEQFWIDPINNNLGKIVYFHNWGGYDSILSLPGYTFEPIINQGEVMGLTILNSKGRVVLAIKDSIRILPGALEIGEFFGFVQATVRAPANEYIGLLPIKLKGRLICPGRTFKGFFFSEELLFALRNGYTLLELGNIYQFQRGAHTFKGLIQTLNQMKIEAQNNNQPTIRNIAKLLMNSINGRFGMHTDLTKQAFLEQTPIEQISRDYSVFSEINFGALSLVAFTLEDACSFGHDNLSERLKIFVEGLPGNTNVAIAAAVTAHSRMIIHSFKLLALDLGLNIYYSDTDSLVLNGTLPEEHLDNATLGKLKLEHKIQEGIFVMPKVYYLKTEEGKEVTKCKGFPGKLSRAQYLELLEGRTLHLEITKWSRSLKESFVKIERNLPYDLSFSFNKRQQVFENGKWVNTTPLILNT